MNATKFRQDMFRWLPDLETKGLTPVPRQEFWDYYHDNKKLFKEADILVIKTVAEIWYIIAKPYIEPDKRARIDELKKEHLPECGFCEEHRELIRKAAKDDTIQYFWDCIDCDKKSGAIPHELAEHLIENEGQAVRDIE